MRKNERGIALAMTLITMTVIGVMIVGMLFVSTIEQRTSDATRNGEKAFSTTEAGSYEVVRLWNPATYNRHGLVGADSIIITNTLSPDSTGRFSGVVYRLTNSTYLIDVTGRDSVGLRANIRNDVPARSRVGLIARIRPITVPGQAAFVSFGNVKNNGSTNIDGTNLVPTAVTTGPASGQHPGWAPCDSVGGNGPGILRPAGSTLTSSGGANTIAGFPPDSPTLLGSFGQFGDLTFADLAASARQLASNNYSNPAPVVLSGLCNTAVDANWGDGKFPSAPCGDYFPMLYAPGGLTVNNGEGQGFLLVNGDLSLGGGFNYYGVIIVNGDIKISGGGNPPVNIWGTVIAKNFGGGSVLGKMNLHYSSCAITRASNHTGIVSLARSRAWSQLY